MQPNVDTVTSVKQLPKKEPLRVKVVIWESTAAKQATVPIVPQVGTKMAKEKRPASNATSTPTWIKLANHPKPIALVAVLIDRLEHLKEAQM